MLAFAGAGRAETIIHVPMEQSSMDGAVSVFSNVCAVTYSDITGRPSELRGYRVVVIWPARAIIRDDRFPRRLAVAFLFANGVSTAEPAFYGAIKGDSLRLRMRDNQGRTWAFNGRFTGAREALEGDLTLAGRSRGAEHLIMPLMEAAETPGPCPGVSPPQ